jgi:predicted HTH domain antitoxin
MEITLQVPEPVVRALGSAPETLPRRALEALLVDECALGRLSRGKVAELLGLGFHDTEELLRGHRVPYSIKTSDAAARDNALLPQRR